VLSLAVAAQSRASRSGRRVGYVPQGWLPSPAAGETAGADAPRAQPYFVEQMNNA
jgi:hypothetical protein